MAGLTKSERKKLIEIIKSATINEPKMLDEIIKLAIPEGYSEICVIHIMKELSRYTFFNKIIIQKGDEFSDTKYSYKWTE